jgi:hypothetical protein
VTNRELARVEGFVGRIYDVVMQRHVLGSAARLRDLDNRAIDATAEGVGLLTQALGRGLRNAVTGNAQHYGLIMAAGVLAAIAFAVFRQ